MQDVNQRIDSVIMLLTMQDVNQCIDSVIKHARCQEDTFHEGTEIELE